MLLQWITTGESTEVTRTREITLDSRSNRLEPKIGICRPAGSRRPERTFRFVRGHGRLAGWCSVRAVCVLLKRLRVFSVDLRVICRPVCY